MNDIYGYAAAAFEMNQSLEWMVLVEKPSGNI